MFARLLDRLDSPRRHLTFLVGLLILTFVFTGLLALEARRAEISRQQTAQGVLRDMAAGVAQTWSVTARQYTYSGLTEAVRKPAQLLLRDAQVPLAAISEQSGASRFCVNCELSIGVPEFFDISLATTAQPQDGLSHRLRQRILRHAQAGLMPNMNERLSSSLFLGHNAAGEPIAIAAYAVFDDSSELQRLIGFEVPMVALREMIEYSFSVLDVVHPALTNGLPNDTFFVASAEIDGVELLTPASVSDYTAQMVIAESEPLPGLELTVGVRPLAERRLVIGGTSAPRLPLLLALLIVISGLIVMALLLVRREAELVRLRADFVSAVSHELRTPLAQIRMFTETLLLGRVRSDVERRRSLEIIDQEARRLTHLVENVLLFSKTEGGRDTRLARESTPFAEEVRLAVESFAPMCRSRGVEIRTELQENIIANVDRGALRQILINLVDNALKYGPAGQRITVGLALFGEVARLWVDDEGPGIPESERDRVFESFHRVQRDVEQRTAGSGIGLAVVRELARLHGGDVRAEDAPGGGARMVVEFPGAHLEARPSHGLAAAS